MSVETVDPNCLSYWFPKLADPRFDLPVPETEIVRTDADLWNWLDGMKAEGDDEFLAELKRAAEKIGLPCFLRTGHTSGKHSWHETCFVKDARTIDAHVARLVEESAMAIPGLPTNVWAVRKLIDTEPLFHAFGGMPITREFRVFIRDDEIEHVQPYWPPDSIVEPGRRDWFRLLARASHLTNEEASDICFLAGSAAGAIHDHAFWSVDVLQDRHEKWWITDMANGDQSFRWEPDEETFRVHA